MVGLWPKGSKRKTQMIVGAERTHELIDIGIEPIDRGRDEDDRRDADGDAEDRKPGAQFVFAQCFQRQLDGFACLTVDHEFSSQFIVLSSQ